MSTWPDNLICEFTVPGTPVAQPRVKACIRGKHAGVYTPTRGGIADYKALLRLKAADQYDGEPLDRPFRVVCEFVFPRPAAKTWKKRPMPSYPHTSKPDADNCVKAVLDALAFLWVDDSRVCSVEARKRVAAGDEQPHTWVMVFSETQAAAKRTGGMPLLSDDLAADATVIGGERIGEAVLYDERPRKRTANGQEGT